MSSRAPACPKCGFPINESSPRTASTPIVVTPAKSRGVAILLALVLGGIGAHKFYVGKPGVGVLYMLLVWTFIPMLIGLIEAIQYLLMSDQAFQEKLLAKKL